MNETSNSKATQTKNVWLIVIMIFAALIGVMAYIYSKTNDETTEHKTNLSEVIDHSEIQNVALETTQRAIKALKTKNEDLQKKIENEMTSQSAIQKDLNDRINQLEAVQHSAQPLASVQTKTLENEVEIDTSIHEIKINLSKKTIKPEPKKNVNSYVPSGTFVKAVMLGGADASAAVLSQAIVSPMVFRIIEDGTLPNHKKSHLKNCTVLGGVVGDISSERGLIRTEQISCVFPNGQILDTKVEGAVFGPEGKNGVKGIPLWREEALLQRAFVAGTLSGLAEGITNTYSTQSVSPEGVVSAIKDGKVFQAAGAKGVGKAMDRLAEYNIQRAEQYHPVIQLSAGTVVDIVFLNGFYLNDEKNENNNKTNDGYTSSKLFEQNNFWSSEGQKHYEELRGAPAQ